MRYDKEAIRREPSPYTKTCQSMDDRMKELEKIADIFDLEVKFNDKETEDNSGSAAGEIFLGRFDDKENMTIAFFHELCHCVAYGLLCGKINSEDTFRISSHLAHEGFIWEHAFFMAAEYGYSWPYDHSVYKYAYKCLFTYVFNEYDDFLRNNNVSDYDIEKEIKYWKFRGELDDLDKEYDKKKKDIYEKYDIEDKKLYSVSKTVTAPNGELVKVVTLDEQGEPIK